MILKPTTCYSSYQAKFPGTMFYLKVSKGLEISLKHNGTIYVLSKPSINSKSYIWFI